MPSSPFHRARAFLQSPWSWRLPLLAAAALAAAFLLLAKFLPPLQPPAPAAPPAPNFLLRDQRGRRTSLDQFRGKVVLLTFLDPICRQLCPLTTQSMLDAVQRLGPAAAQKVELLGVNVNLQRLQVADVAAYSRIHALRRHWRFLTGSPAQLKKVWRAYHVYVAISPGGDVEHFSVTYVIGPHGRERAVFSTPMRYAAVGSDSAALAKAIAPLLPGPPALAAAQPPLVSLSLTEPPPAALPAAKLSYPIIEPRPDRTSAHDRLRAAPAPGRISFANAHPHLVLFFAGWLASPAVLRRHLAALGHYALSAKLHHWPSPVAVDVLPAEPSPAAARRRLASLAAGLRIPLVADSSGGLADAYQVNDLPWYALGSPSGRLLWRHDGWLSAGALSQAARAHSPDAK